MEGNGKNLTELARICWGIFADFLALLILPAGKRLPANCVSLSLSFYFSFSVQGGIVEKVLDLVASSLFIDHLYVSN